jgi:hypothetical protein
VESQNQRDELNSRDLGGVMEAYEEVLGRMQAQG